MSPQRDSGSKPDPHRCPHCGMAVAAGDRFCRGCGASLSEETKSERGFRGPAGLRAFGLALIALAALYALFHYGAGGARQEPAPTQPISITEVGGGGAPEEPVPSSPRDEADMLFNQAMTAYETGDSATARQYIPLAIAAYRGLAELDLDSRYHLALLSLAADRPRDALAHADTMLASVPDHLLALSASARAHTRLGHPDDAARFYRRFLDLYTPERAASRSEYIDHARALPARREEARAYLQEQGLLEEGAGG